MNKYILNNKISTIIKQNKNTPRIAFVMHIKLNTDEKYAGLYYLMTQLLFQGTAKRNSQELASELEENAIDIRFEKKADYIRIKLQCLNEDIKLAFELLQDIVENSTFNEIEKEKIKIIGEFNADLDSAKVQAQDNYYRTIFPNHGYGIGRNEIIDSLSEITKEDVIAAWEDLKVKSQKNIVIVGDTDEKEIIEILNNSLKNFKSQEQEDIRKKINPICENKVAVIEKEDANQAQIFQGWHFPDVYSKDYPTIVLLNTILGACGLSSRLFLELREKQGLAYTVRSVFEPYILSGNFFVYIGTEPKNIKTSINGFDIEINKIMNEFISDEELENAKNNAIGKRQFYSETNLLEACLKGYYEFLGLGFDFENELIQRIQSVTKEDIINCAKKYFSKPSVLCVLAPKKYLKDADLC